MTDQSVHSPEDSRLLITGASGQLGSYLLAELRRRGRSAVAWSHQRGGQHFGFPLTPINLANDEQIERGFSSARPATIVHAAAMSRMDECYREPELAQRINVGGTRRLAELARASGARLVFVSTDLVFDGEQGNYRETDPARPLSCYGRTKREAESFVLDCPSSVVVRISLLFGPSLCGRPTFYDQQRAALRERRSFALFYDEWRTPLAYPVAAAALLAIADSTVTGLLHVGGPERLSRYEAGRRFAQFLGLDPTPLESRSRLDAPLAEPRPADTSLDSSRFRSLFPTLDWPDYRQSLERLNAQATGTS